MINKLDQRKHTRLSPENVIYIFNYKSSLIIKIDRNILFDSVIIRVRVFSYKYTILVYLTYYKSRLSKLKKFYDKKLFAVTRDAPTPTNVVLRSHRTYLVGPKTLQ